MSGDDNPLLKRKPRKPTEAELLAWNNLARNPTEFWKIPLDVVPYIKFGSPSGVPGLGMEIGMKGTF